MFALTSVLTILLATVNPAHADNTPLRIGSKRFTESYILGEALRAQAATAGSAEHRAGLGNTGIVLAALQSGAIDLYPEYTGTIAREILHRPDLTRLEELRQPLRAIGLAAAVPLGFSDTYALAVANRASAGHTLHSIADLGQVRGLRIALSQEFLQRSDGWPALAAAYHLQDLPVRGMDHGLAYDAVAQGAVDVIDAYSTDARLARDPLQVLGDPLQVIPPYDAVLLYRIDLPERHPAQWQALQALSGRFNATAMRRANARVDLDHVSFAQAASELLATGAQRSAGTNAAAAAAAAAAASPSGNHATARFWHALWGADLLPLTLQHLGLVLGPVLLASLLGIPLGVLAATGGRPGATLLGTVGVLQTIPALALLALLIAWTGQIGMLPALLALFIYALLPIVSATQAALFGLDRNLREAAIALGAPWSARLLHVELPAVRPALLAGVRTAAVINVGGATLAAFVGAGGYGERIVSGLAVNDPALLLAGAVPTATLALLIQAAFGWLIRVSRP